MEFAKQIVKVPARRKEVENRKLKRKDLIIGILAVLVVILAFSAGSLWSKVQVLEKGDKTFVAGTEEGKTNSGQVEVLKEDDHLRGNREARILLIEYSDLECPFCQRFHQTAKQLVDEYPDQVAWVYRHFPLDRLHSKARKEAEATECAAELGGNDGFWRLTDKIYEVTPSNNGLDLASLPDLAAEVGLDKQEFEECLNSGRQAKGVEEDYLSGVKAGITGTPGNILFDTQTGEKRLIPGAVSLSQLKKEVDSLLAK